ncbi:VRR-NUC domain-containing protein [Lactobacillus sp. ESL0731]|uniref:VRR-NUC domain-containing protein n=1 Tax=unclassified Lactobacillus TaxID=2620435 RepID=UPI0023F87982|nr:MULTISPECIES: VRR-NUC domain-containing protein [unclassified Lactobacillus]WEV51658.1 VRR-NUC domain-containing protein [Lactobacillus sp. ESL0700]WEV62787.1 VRR-NUC domain-containing protein [Lactobacillus sp. ESL0731]
MTELKTEHDIQNSIRLAFSQRHYLCFRANVGKVLMQNGRWFDTGLPKGFPDLFGYDNLNKPFFIEVKNAKGKPRPDQIRFHEMLSQRNICHGIARSPEEAIAIVKGDLIGYGY